MEEQKPDYIKWLPWRTKKRGEELALGMLFLKTEVKKHVGEETQVRLRDGRANRGASAGGSVFNKL